MTFLSVVPWLGGHFGYILFFFCSGEGKGESVWKCQEGGGLPGGWGAGCLRGTFFWGGGGLNSFFRRRNPTKLKEYLFRAMFNRGHAHQDRQSRSFGDDATISLYPLRLYAPPTNCHANKYAQVDTPRTRGGWSRFSAPRAKTFCTPEPACRIPPPPSRFRPACERLRFFAGTARPNGIADGDSFVEIIS